jgi:hypothetical protein
MLNRNLLPPSSGWKMEVASYFEMFITTYETTRCHDVEDHNFNFQGRDNLTSHMTLICIFRSCYSRLGSRSHTWLTSRLSLPFFRKAI